MGEEVDFSMVKDLMFPGLDEFNYNPMNDAIFKFIFGKEERKQITIDFLNAVLEKSLGHPIQDLIFSGTEMNPENAMDKLTRLDVACILDSGEQVDVEVQVINERNMERRTLFYWAQMYLMSLPAGKTYDQLKPAITVNLLDFIFLPQKNPHAMYSIYNKENGDRLTRDLEIHFLEVPKYARRPDQPISGMTKMERWLAYFANQLDKKGKEELAMSDPEIRKAMEAARIFLNNTEERRLYINREMARMDRQSQLENAKAEGENRMGQLMMRLVSEGKMDQLEKAASDRDLRERLYKKYNIE